MAPSVLPALDVRRHLERARTTRLILAREIALQRQLGATIKGIGDRAARHFMGGVDVETLDFRRSLSAVLRPSIRATAVEFSKHVTKSVTVGHEVKLFEDL